MTPELPPPPAMTADEHYEQLVLLNKTFADKEIFLYKVSTLLGEKDAKIAELLAKSEQQAADKPSLIEVFADNGEHSHWQLVDPQTGTVLWDHETAGQQAAELERVKEQSERRKKVVQEHAQERRNLAAELQLLKDKYAEQAADLAQAKARILELEATATHQFNLGCQDREAKAKKEAVEARQRLAEMDRKYEGVVRDNDALRKENQSKGNEISALKRQLAEKEELVAELSRWDDVDAMEIAKHYKPHGYVTDAWLRHLTRDINNHIRAKLAQQQPPQSPE